MLPAAHAKRGRSCRRQGFFHMENIVNSFNSLYKAYRKTRCGKRDNPTAMRYRMEAIERTAGEHCAPSSKEGVSLPHPAPYDRPGHG